MDHARIVALTAGHVRAQLDGEGTGHDWWHVERVWRMALRIGEQEDVDLFVVELAALLHDVADWKFHDGDEEVGSRRAAAWLAAAGVDDDTVSHVAGIVRDLSFKGAGVDRPMPTRAGEVVQDADRLDAIGAIGIARAFAYGGFRGQALYVPGEPPVFHASFESYRAGSGSTINHFSEKLLLLKDRMTTEPGRRIAAERHRVLEQFLERFHAEWEGRV